MVQELQTHPAAVVILLIKPSIRAQKAAGLTTKVVLGLSRIVKVCILQLHLFAVNGRPCKALPLQGLTSSAPFKSVVADIFGDQQAIVHNKQLACQCPC